MAPTVIDEIEHIKEILPNLSETAVHELRAFTDYLADREKRRIALEQRILAVEKNPQPVECNSPEEFIQAILDQEDDES